MTETARLSQRSPAPRLGREDGGTGPAGVLGDALAVAIAILGGTALGAATAHAQGRLPFDLAPLANSSGSWALAAFAVALLANRASVAAACGTLTLGALVVGYYGAHGLSLTHPAFEGQIVFWVAIALLAGPFLGLAAHGLRHGTGMWAALGLALMSGTLIGEGVSSLHRVADSTSATYWRGEILAGVVLLAVGAVLRLRAPAAVAAAVATVLVAGTFVVAYGVVPVALGYL